MFEIEIDDPLQEIPSFIYECWNVEECSFNYNKLQYIDFFKKHMITNLPCLIKSVACDWECTKYWVKNEHINYDYIHETYGDLYAPVADCNDIHYNSHSNNDMKVSDFIDYLKSRKYNRLLYLKDWHLRKSNPEDNFYEIPLHFALDWLNEFAVDNKEDDFMFVYMGPQGSWTPVHEDVYCSYSWSVNVVGRKKWTLFPPGEENKLKDALGNLPLIFEPEKYEDIKYFEIIQEKGEAIFVPSGWHHQVINEVNTISVNHNWINACNIHLVWKALQNTLLRVEHQIEEFKCTPEFPSECQLILKSLFGMNFEGLVTLLCYIGKKRLKQLQGESRIALGKYFLGMNIIKFDLKNIFEVMESIVTHPVFLNKVLISSVEDEFEETKKYISQVLFS